MLGFAKGRHPDVYAPAFDRSAGVRNDVFSVVTGPFESNTSAERQDGRICGDQTSAHRKSARGVPGQTISGSHVSLRCGGDSK